MSAKIKKKTESTKVFCFFRKFCIIKAPESLFNFQGHFSLERGWCAAFRRLLVYSLTLEMSTSPLTMA